MWTEIRNNACKTFQAEDNEPVLIHIIKTGFVDRYITVYEDAYDQTTGQIYQLTAQEIFEKHGIQL